MAGDKAGVAPKDIAIFDWDTICIDRAALMSVMPARMICW